MLSGMGNDRIRVDTTNPEAQRWFDYALTLARAFEHDDAKLPFRKAASLDPSCSLCVWGEAYSLGPTINFQVSRKQSAAALSLALKARRLAGRHLPEEGRRLGSAMVDRHSHVDESGSSDLQYAKDLDELVQSDPKNLELNIFEAEAWLIMESHDDRPFGNWHYVAAGEVSLRAGVTGSADEPEAPNSVVAAPAPGPFACATAASTGFVGTAFLDCINTC